MLFVWLGIFALFIGPLLVCTVGRFEPASRVLDSFVVVAIGGLVFLHILPESLAEAGWPALGAVLLGATIPTLLHSPLHALSAPCHHRGTSGLLALAALAMGLHAFFDGVALAPSGAAPLALGHLGHLWGEHSHVALAVILHRLLEGTGLWYLMRPALGRPRALVAMALLAMATWLGFVGAGLVVASGGEVAMAWVQAAVAGSLLHVLAHHAPGSQAPARRWAWESAVGLGLGTGLLAMLSQLEEHTEHACAHGHAGHQHPSLLGTAADLGLEMGPWVLASLGVTALVHALVPSGLPKVGMPQTPSAWRNLGHIVLGAVRGLLTDTAFARVTGLYAHAEADAPHAGAKQPATTAFLLLAPAFGVTAGLMSLAAFGLPATLCRVGGLIVWACAASLGLGAPKSAAHLGDSSPACTQARPVRATRLGDGVHFALGEGVDTLGPWLLLGLMLAALMQQTLGVAELAWWTRTQLDVVVVGALAAPVYLSPVAATLIGLVLWHKGLSLGAWLSFSLCASAISVVSVRQLAPLHGRAKAWACMLGLYAMSCLLGFVVNAHAADLLGPQSPNSMPAWLTLVASGVVAGLVAVSCLRQGVRAFLAPVTAWSMHLGRHHHH